MYCAVQFLCKYLISDITKRIGIRTYLIDQLQFD